MRRSRTRVRVMAWLAAATLIGGSAACSSTPSPKAAIDAFLTGWRTGTFPSSVTVLAADGSTMTGAGVADKIKQLSGDLADHPPTLTPGKPTIDGSTATVPIAVSWPVTGGVVWSYHSALRLTRSGDTWHPIFEPQAIAPSLHPGDSLAVHTTPAKRASILDGAGKPMVRARPVVHVGIEPKLVTDRDALLSALDAAFRSVDLDVDLSGLPDAIDGAKPDAFVPVVTLRRPVYEQIRSKIHDLPGTVFRDDTQQLAPTRTFARALLGTVGDVTKERMDDNPGVYQIGDQVGFGGLQEAYDKRLRGTPGVSVVVTTAKSDDTTKAGRPVFQVDPVPGQPIKTTIDVATQQAAEKALAGWSQNTALVAIRISDGALLAVANGPDAQGQDLALDAQVPPGSMFKTVTATHLLETGQVTADTIVPCPETLTVGGYTFHNAGNEHFGKVPLHVDFAKSCNTAFASLAPKLGDTGLADTAKQLGVGIPWDLGIDVFTGKVSTGSDPVEQAAAAFGQGKTLVSPVAMAAMAAAVARGQWKQPHLLLDPAPANPAADQPPLKKSTVDALHQMMREVVTDGTGVKVKDVPGDPIYGKTGTAEYDNDPDHTHSWFMGFRGDIAFAVFVQNGGASTEAAVPIAGTFFTLLG